MFVENIRGSSELISTAVLSTIYHPVWVCLDAANELAKFDEVDELDEFDELGKLDELDDELKSIDGYYTYDGGCEIVNGGLLKDLDYPYHPDEDSFHLIPKSDVVRTFFKIKSKPNFGGNRIVIWNT